MPEHFRVTYATLSADNEDLQAAYDKGIRVARSWFGQTLPAFVSGQPRTSHIRRREPGRPGRVVPRARGYARRPRGRGGRRVRCCPRVGRDLLAGADRRAASRRRPHQRPFQRAVGADEHGGREEPARGARRCRGDRRPHPVLLQADRGQRRVQPDDGPAVSARVHHERAAAVWHLGSDQPVQLPDGPRRRSRWRRTGSRQRCPA